MAKRGNNEGSVYQRKNDGKWVGAITLGVNAQGNPRRRVVYGKTRQEASKKLAELLDKYHKGLLAEPSTITVAEFAKDWVERETVGKAKSTKRNYTIELEYACVYMGKVRLQAVKPAHIRAMLDMLATEGYHPKQTKKEREAGTKKPPKPYSPRNQKMVLQRLSAMFRDAVRLELIYRNPCEAIKVKAAPSEPVGRALEPHEMAVLLRACEAHPTMGLFFRLLLDTGLRKGEALALTWADINLEAIPPRLSVNKAWTCDTKGGVMTKPKTKRSNRVVPLPSGIAEALRVLKAGTIQTFGPNFGGLHLFGDAITGKPYNPQSPNHALNRICEREGLGKIRVHDLRHTFGSVLLSKGVPLEVVSERMGHANPTITLNVYRHLLEKERTDYVMGSTEVVTDQTKGQPSIPMA